MSTGPGPTRKPDGTADASVDDIADLLVEDEPSVQPADEVSSPGAISADESLDVVLETPGPAVANPFMPPPPSPMDDGGDSADEHETADDNGAATNLAYEDLLAKLVLPAKAPEPEPEMPALMSSLPLPEPTAPLTPILSPPPAFPGPAAPSLQIAPPTEERTLVTENPLVAEEQEAAVREGRLAFRSEPPLVIHEQPRGLVTEPIATNGMAKSRLFYLMLGGLLVLGGMILAVLLLKLLMPTPAVQAPAIIAPTPPPPPPPSAPPAHVEPLPPSPPPAAAVPAELPAAAPENPSAIPETAPTLEAERPQPRPRPAVRPRPPRSSTPRTTSAPKAAPAPKAAAPRTSKPAKKPSKLSGYADPFDN